MYTGQSLVDRQLSPLYWQCIYVEQSLLVLQPCHGVSPREQVPPLVALGQSASCWQVWLLWVEQVPMLGQLPPGLVHRTFVPYLQ